MIGGDPGNWITNPNYLPWWVAAATHLVFGWTIALLYPLGVYTPYRGQEIGSRVLENEGSRPWSKELPRHEELVDERLVLWYFVAALDLHVRLDAGRAVDGLQLHADEPFRGIELFSPGRWRMIHTNAIAYGFLANAFLGMLHWAVPRLTLKPVLAGGFRTRSSSPGRSW